ncbi:hypothetical protein [Paenimyroides aestuarii]|uniref:YD repeat-containing protein n=1 Tax=Paenimyroides aestuarii TaxID=2968490 RepID=A0ABY5NS54_9FLAO|nr:hypothetical protein [Paenimyroides aestuarii]UUV21363.1 hypothetical protein NPX36_13690 [Paenimyroides aestuarii]
MKNLVLLLFIFIIIACSNDDFLRSDLDRQRTNEVVETPPLGKKIKKMTDRFGEHHYYYNSSGFIDSIYSRYRGQNSSGFDSFSIHKFNYNKGNKLISIVNIHAEGSIESPINEYESNNHFTYNKSNQIIQEHLYIKATGSTQTTKYEYNNDGSVKSNNKYYLNENLIVEKSNNEIYTYSYNDRTNPFYNIYTKAYKAIKSIDKNDRILIERTADGGTSYAEYFITYDNDNYKVNEHLKYPVVDFYSTYEYY